MTIMSQQTASQQDEFVSLGLSQKDAGDLAAIIETGLAKDAPMETWRRVCTELLRPEQPFEAHLRAHQTVFANWDASERPAPVWIPDPESIAATNLAGLMGDRSVNTYEALFNWSIEDRSGFWHEMIQILHIRFTKKAERLVANEHELESPISPARLGCL